MYYECCVCKISRKDAILHRFPFYSPDRLNKWLKCLNRDDLKRLPQQKISNLYICQKHFEKRFITQKSHLVSKSYPSLFTEVEISSGIPSSENAGKYITHYFSTRHHHSPALIPFIRGRRNITSNRSWCSGIWPKPMSRNKI